MNEWMNECLNGCFFSYSQYQLTALSSNRIVFGISETKQRVKIYIFTLWSITNTEYLISFCLWFFWSGLLSFLIHPLFHLFNVHMWCVDWICKALFLVVCLHFKTFLFEWLTDEIWIVWAIMLGTGYASHFNNFLVLHIFSQSFIFTEMTASNQMQKWNDPFQGWTHSEEEIFWWGFPHPYIHRPGFHSDWLISIAKRNYSMWKQWNILNRSKICVGYVEYVLWYSMYIHSTYL